MKLDQIVAPLIEFVTLLTPFLITLLVIQLGIACRILVLLKGWFSNGKMPYDGASKVEALLAATAPLTWMSLSFSKVTWTTEVGMIMYSVTGVLILVAMVCTMKKQSDNNIH